MMVSHPHHAEHRRSGSRIAHRTTLPASFSRLGLVLVVDQPFQTEMRTFSALIAIILKQYLKYYNQRKC